MPKHNRRYEANNEAEESEDDYGIVDSGEEDISPWQNGHESEPEDQQKPPVVSTPKENGSRRQQQSNISSLKSNNSDSPYKVESGVALSPKNDREPTEPLFSSGSKKQALRFHQVMAAYKNPGEPMTKHQRRGSTGGIAVKDQEEMMDDLQKLRKNVGELSNERVQLKTKILRMEAEIQKKDKHIEEILGAKANIGNGTYGKLLTETTLIANLKRQVKSLEKDIGKRDEELLKMRNKMKGSKSAQLEQQLAEVTAQKMQLESILENNRQEVDREYSDTVKALEEVNDRMKNKLQKYRAVNKKRTTLVQQLQQTNSSLEERKAELLEENSNLQSKLQESQFQSNLKITELTERNTFLEEESNRKASGATAEVTALNEVIEKMRNDHKEQIEKLHQEHLEQLEKLKADHAAQLAEIEASRKQESERYKTEIEALQISPNAEVATKKRPISKYDGNEDKAAAKIQASFKGHQVRKNMKSKKAEVVQPIIQITPDSETMLKSAKPKEDVEEQKAAVTIQRVYKGKKARDDFKQKKQESAKNLKKEIPEEVKLKAVIRIQKIFRGYKARKEYKKRKLTPIKTTLSPRSELQKLIGGDISPRSRFELGGFLGRPDYSKMIVESEPQFVLA